MDNRVQPRRPNGKRLEGKGLAIKVAQDIKGMMLAQAYIVVKSWGFAMRVSRLDGIARGGFDVYDDPTKASTRVHVDVSDGVVMSAWVK